MKLFAENIEYIVKFFLRGKNRVVGFHHILHNPSKQVGQSTLLSVGTNFCLKNFFNDAGGQEKDFATQHKSCALVQYSAKGNHKGITPDNSIPKTSQFLIKPVIKNCKPYKKGQPKVAPTIIHFSHAKDAIHPISFYP